MLRLTLPASWNIAILTIFCLGYFDSSLYPVSSDDIKNVATDRCYRSFILKADLPNCSRMILEFARTDIRFSLRFPTILKEIDVLLDLHLYKKKGGKRKKKERKKNGYERFVSDVKIHGSRECALFESKKFSCATRPPLAFIRRKWEKVSFGEQTGADIDYYATRIEMCLNFLRAPALCTLPLIFLLKYFIHSCRWRIVLIK